METVLDNARLLGMISNLSPDEQTLLKWSALFHDIGNGAMAYKKEYDLDVASDEDARDRHQLFTVQILKKWYDEGMFEKIISEDDLNTICTMCERHRKRSALPEDQKTRRLCSLLRVADALDKTNNRARYNDDGVPYSEFVDKLQEEKPESILHWEAQRAIEGIRLHISRDRIRFEFLVTDPVAPEFMIEDFKEELKPLKDIIPAWETLAMPVPKDPRIWYRGIPHDPL